MKFPIDLDGVRLYMKLFYEHQELYTLNAIYMSKLFNKSIELENRTFQWNIRYMCVLLYNKNSI